MHDNPISIPSCGLSCVSSSCFISTLSITCSIWIHIFEATRTVVYSLSTVELESFLHLKTTASLAFIFITTSILSRSQSTIYHYKGQHSQTHLDILFPNSCASPLRNTYWPDIARTFRRDCLFRTFQDSTKPPTRLLHFLSVINYNFRSLSPLLPSAIPTFIVCKSFLSQLSHSEETIFFTNIWRSNRRLATFAHSHRQLGAGAFIKNNLWVLIPHSLFTHATPLSSTNYFLRSKNTINGTEWKNVCFLVQNWPDFCGFLNWSRRGWLLQTFSCSFCKSGIMRVPSTHVQSHNY